MRLDTIMFGVLAAWIKFNFIGLWKSSKNYFFCFGLILLAINFYFGFVNRQWALHDTFMNSFYFTFVGLGIMFLVPKADSIKSGKGIWLRFFTYTSLISYSIYLLNYSLILKCIQHFIPINSIAIALIAFILFWALVYLLSILLYKFIELPFLNYRDRITQKSKEI